MAGAKADFLLCIKGAVPSFETGIIKLAYGLMGGEGSSVLGGEVENAFNPFSPEGQDGGKEGGNRLPDSGWVFK